MYLDPINKSFVRLGLFIKKVLTQNFKDDYFSAKLKFLIDNTYKSNPWFTNKNIIYSLEAISYALNESRMNKWLSNYNINRGSKKNIFIVMANNIPLVGMYDFIYVLISRNRAIIKTSKGSEDFLKLFAEFLIRECPELRGDIVFVNEFVQDKDNIDAIIATGGDNTYRYFEYYFRNIPHVIRKNKTSVAVLTEKTTQSQIKKLASDIFTYYGMGCRNVSKLYLNKGFDIQRLFKEFIHFKDIIDNYKYSNNYKYNRVMYMMKNIEFLENGFVILTKNSNDLDSPIAVLYYDYYYDLLQLKKKLDKLNDKIQCIVADCQIDNQVEFGQTQRPQLHNYADNFDIMKFLINLNS